MKKLLWCLAAALLVGALDLWPFRQEDAGALYLVETLLVEADASGIELYAGDLSAGGGTMDEALSALEERAPGQLFLRQTKRVIFCAGAERYCSPMDLPEQVPMGAALYSCRAGAEALEPEPLGEILEARERRMPETPTLAQGKNSVMLGEPTALAEIGEDVYEG